IGAGPTGLTAALALAQHGVPVRLIERDAAFHQMSRGSGVHARTVEMFRLLGVHPAFARTAAHHPPTRAYALPEGRRVVREWHILEEPVITPDRPYVHLQGHAMISQFQTQGILRAELEKYGVRVELGVELVGLEQREGEVVATVRRVGAVEEQIHAAYVVGADGAKGKWTARASRPTRKAIGAKFEGETQDGAGAVWAEADVEGEGITTEYWHMWSKPGEAAVSMRPKGSAPGYHIGLIGLSFDPIGLDESPEKFIEAVHNLTGRKDLVFKDLHTLMYWRPSVRMVDKMSEGRVFIAGDAAHVHPPTGGQGLNTGILDAMNLAWKLALAYRGHASATLLASYEAERLPVILQMLMTTSGFWKDAGKGGDFQWQNAALTQLEVNYRWSAAVRDRRGPSAADEDMKALAYAGYGREAGVRAGDRAPEVAGLVDGTGAETSLYALLKSTEHTVLVRAGGDGEQVVDVVKAVEALPAGTAQVVIVGQERTPSAMWGATRVYHDKEGWVERGYGGRDAPCVVVVRPDGYVGAMVDGGAGVGDYFANIML
ncbi:FAD binding domain-containing protein, partial [Epithele typhae]|uniref:FAD binding domain-containing protein n=1 Tax=Epithele typhae TaxID=378194 RepID=UPI0020075B41